MKQKDIIAYITKMVQREAYQARVHDELKNWGIDVEIMKFHGNVANGKAFGGLQTLHFMTGKSHDDIYEKAVEEATQDIKGIDSSNYDRMIIKLLDLAGFDGKAYYSIITQYTA